MFFSPKQSLETIFASPNHSLHSKLYTFPQLYQLSWKGIGQTQRKDDSCDSIWPSTWIIFLCPLTVYKSGTCVVCVGALLLLHNPKWSAHETGSGRKKRPNATAQWVAHFFNSIPIVLMSPIKNSLFICFFRRIVTTCL